MVSPIVGLVSMIMPMAISVAALGEHLSGATGAGAALVVGGLVVLLSGAAGEDVKEGVA
jgi:drug/metabolite transporter (DMT)-like permease